MKARTKTWGVLLLSMLLIGTSVILNSCGDDKIDEVHLNVSTSAITLSSTGNDSSPMDISCNSDWSIYVGQDWVTLSRTSGNGDASILVSATKNQTAEKRTATVTITAGSITRNVRVTQDAGTEILKVTPTDITLGMNADASAEVTITTSEPWSVEAKYDNNENGWLMFNSSGNGRTSMKISAKSKNNTSSVRTATLTIKTETQSANIYVRQEAGVPVCYVEPANVVALYDEMAWEYQATGNVNTFQYGIFSANAVKYLTDKEITDLISTTEVLKFAGGYLSQAFKDIYGNYIVDDQEYYICIIAYDEQNVAGELKKTRVKVPEYKSSNDDAWVAFSEVSAGSSSFSFNVTKRGLCDKYHLIYGNLSTDDAPNTYALYAFLINYYLNHNKLHWFAEQRGLKIQKNYPNSDSFTFYSSAMYTKPYCIAMGWGVFQNGTLSSDMLGFQWNWQESSLKPISMADKLSHDIYRKNMDITPTETIIRKSLKK